MKPTDLTRMLCPMARALGCVGEWWSLLILRDTLQGFRRFDELQHSLGIGSAMLSRRLRHMVDEGLLEKRPYQTRPLRHEYVPTDKGRDLYPVLVMLGEWGNRYMNADGRMLKLVDGESRRDLSPLVVDRHSGEPITSRNSTIAAGEQAGEAIHRRLERMRDNAVRDAQRRYDEE